MSYPVSLSQLLTEGPFNDCLNSFIYDSGEFLNRVLQLVSFFAIDPGVLLYANVEP